MILDGGSDGLGYNRFFEVCMCAWACSGACTAIQSSSPAWPCGVPAVAYYLSPMLA
jgi:hypothetical protein